MSTHEIAMKQIEKIGEPVSIEATNTTEDIVVPEAVAPTTTKKPTKTEAVKTEMAEKKNARKEEVVSTETTVIQNEPVEKNENDAGLESGETGKEVTAKLPPQKKKPFKERMSDLLKTRKPVEETVEATPMPSDSNGERTAKRRDDNTQEAPVLTDVSQQVEIKTNKIADSWMIGVKNLKLTLFNRSKLTITSAKLEVLYYSEQNNLIEKKILSFNNIPPNKSQTVAAPDQRLADHPAFTFHQ